MERRYEVKWSDQRIVIVFAISISEALDKAIKFRGESATVRIVYVAEENI